MPAHLIFFMVQPRLLGPGNMAAIPGSVEPFLGPDATIFNMKVRGLGPGQLTLPALYRNPMILIVQAHVDFSATRMMRAPACSVSAGRGTDSGGGQNKGDENFSFHLQLHLLRDTSIGSPATSYFA